MEPFENAPDHEQRAASFAQRNKVHCGPSSGNNNGGGLSGSASSVLCDSNSSAAGVCEGVCETLRDNMAACCGHMTAEGLDKCARICFPMCFLLFNIMYWSIYTQRVVFEGGRLS